MQLKDILDNLYAGRSQAHLANDPLSFCHRYRDPADQEIVGLIASAFSYGNVKIILRNLEIIFAGMAPSPRAFVEEFEPDRGLALFSGFRHRFNDGRDLCALLLAARTMIEEADSIAEFFLGCYDREADDITPSLITFCAAVLAFDYSPVFGADEIPEGSYFPFFFPSPATGSACKRLCMYLRWMVRPADGIDLGLWHGVSPAKLVIPVDAHIQRIGRYLGLEKVNADGHETECLLLKYQGTDRIFVPLEQMQLVEKYVSKDGVAPPIDRLGSTKWQRTKEKTRKALEDVAKEYAGRLKVAKLNIDDNQATPPKYGIRGIPTLMLFKNGNVEATKVGAVSKSQLTAFIDSNI